MRLLRCTKSQRDRHNSNTATSTRSSFIQIACLLQCCTMQLEPCKQRGNGHTHAQTASMQETSCLAGLRHTLMNQALLQIVLMRAWTVPNMLQHTYTPLAYRCIEQLRCCKTNGASYSRAEAHTALPGQAPSQQQICPLNVLLLNQIRHASILTAPPQTLVSLADPTLLMLWPYEACCDLYAVHRQICNALWSLVPDNGPELLYDWHCLRLLDKHGCFVCILRQPMAFVSLTERSRSRATFRSSAAQLRSAQINPECGKCCADCSQSPSRPATDGAYPVQWQHAPHARSPPEQASLVSTM